LSDFAEWQSMFLGRYEAGRDGGAVALPDNLRGTGGAIGFDCRPTVRHSLTSATRERSSVHVCIPKRTRE